MTKEDQPRLAWAITGSGHFLKETIELVRTLTNADVFLSKAAEEVLRCYHLTLNLPDSCRLYKEGAASAPVVGRFYRGGYKALIIAPTSSNTVAKMVFGISDNLITNLYAHAGKCRVTSIVFPCDTDAELSSEAPDGMVAVYPRRIDLENTRKLADMEYTHVVETIEALTVEVGKLV
jgi:flavoprotein